MSEESLPERAVAVVAFTVVLATLLACRPNDNRAINNQANAEIDRVNAAAARAKRYATCEESHPPEATCGLVADQFFQPANVERIIATSCGGVPGEACREIGMREWYATLIDRYPRANMDEIEQACRSAAARCHEQRTFELVILESHNRAIEALRRQGVDAAVTARDEQTETERQARKQAFANAMSAAGKSMQQSLSQQPQPVSAGSYTPPGAASHGGCTSDYQCSYGQKCVKDSLSYQGVCVQPIDRNGLPVRAQPSNDSFSPGTGSCQFPTDCAIGFRCVKSSGGLYGNCLK